MSDQTKSGNSNQNAPTRTDVARILAAIEDHNRLGQALVQEVKRISSLPPPPAAAPYLEPTRQEKIMALVADAAKEQRGVSTAEIAAKLNLNRQQVQTAIIPLERDAKIITVRGRYEKTPTGPRRSNADYIYSASVLDGWT